MTIAGHWYLSPSLTKAGWFDVHWNGRAIGSVYPALPVSYDWELGETAPPAEPAGWTARYVQSDGTASFPGGRHPDRGDAVRAVLDKHRTVIAGFEPGCTIRASTDTAHCGPWCTCGQLDGPCEPFGAEITGEPSWEQRTAEESAA